MEQLAQSKTLDEVCKAFHDKIKNLGDNLPDLNLTEAMQKLKQPDLTKWTLEQMDQPKARSEFCAEFASELIDGFLASAGLGQSLQSPKDDSLNLKPLSTTEVIGKFIASKRHHVAKTSLGNYETMLRTFSKQYNILPLTPEPVEEFLASKYGATAINYYSAIKMLYEFANGRLGVPNVIEKYKIKRPIVKAKEAVPMTLVQTKTYLDVIEDHRERALVYLCLVQAFRIKEAVSVLIADVGEDVIQVHGKERDEPFPLLPEVRDALLKLADGRSPNEPLFIGEKGHLSVAMGEKIIKGLFVRAGISNVKQSPHTLRHTFATLAGKAGLDVYWIGRLLRHSTKGNRNVTNRYIHYNMDDLRQKLEKFNPLRLINGTGREPFRKFN